MTTERENKYAEGQGLPADLWSVLQACAWMTTHNDSLVERIAQSADCPKQTLDGADLWIALHAASLGIECVQSFGIDGPRKLAESCRSGALTGWGCRNGGGDLCQMQPNDWKLLKIIDHGASIRAAAESKPEATWWSDLHFSAAAVRRQWPGHRPRVATDADGENFRPDPRSEGRIRKAGGGNVPFDDSALVARALDGIERGLYKSPRAAATALAGEIQGGGIEESKIKRLAQKIREANKVARGSS
jgi:hypothetical protein